MAAVRTTAVRTTLVLERQALLELKRLAAEQGRTLSSVVDETLRLGIEQRGRMQSSPACVSLPAFDMGPPRVNLADRDQLYEALAE